MEDIRTFDSVATAAAFPLGGVGTGNVSIGARGELRDWEIFNQPGKGESLPCTFFAIRAASAGQPPITRVLEGPLQPPHALSHGSHPATAAGLPRMARSTLRGTYPIATLAFEDPRLPVRVELEAFTPLVPLDPADSGIPCAIAGLGKLDAAAAAAPAVATAAPLMNLRRSDMLVPPGGKLLLPSIVRSARTLET